MEMSQELKRMLDVLRDIDLISKADNCYNIAENFSNKTSNISSFISTTYWEELGLDSIKASKVPEMIKSNKSLLENIKNLKEVCIKINELKDNLLTLEELYSEYNAIPDPNTLNENDESKVKCKEKRNEIATKIKELESEISESISEINNQSVKASKSTDLSSSSSGQSDTQSNGSNNIDMTDYPTGSSRQDGVERAVLVAKYLVENGGFTKEQAAALVGVYLDENNCDPGSYMAAEKNGKGVSGTGGKGYGAGIGSWTFEGFKKQCLKDAGFPEDTPIESLSLQQQCDMIIAVSNKTSKKYYNALRRCENIEDASATAVLITGGVGFSNNWDTHPTTQEAKNMADYYGQANDKNFGKSDYHWNCDKRRLQYAKEVYALL